MQSYTHLSIEEREDIRSYLDQRKSIRFIAKKLSRSPSTIQREIQRNTRRKRYRAFSAHRLAAARLQIPRRARKLVPHTPLWNLVLEKLRLHWSPQLIARYLRETYPHDMTKQLSHEAIYQAIYIIPRGTLRQELIDCLRQRRKLRRKRRYLKKAETRGKFNDVPTIHERSEEAQERTAIGHWEGDLVLGKYQTSAIGTLVDRLSRKLLICRVDGRKSESVRQGFEKRLRQLPRRARMSLALDRGTEMAQYAALQNNAKIAVYFCDPHSPWQRGTNENTNGLIRSFFPKGTDFNNVSDEELQFVEQAINERPRKCLDYKTPNEVFSSHLGVALRP